MEVEIVAELERVDHAINGGRVEKFHTDKACSCTTYYRSTSSNSSTKYYYTSTEVLLTGNEVTTNQCN